MFHRRFTAGMPYSIPLESSNEAAFNHLPSRSWLIAKSKISSDSQPISCTRETNQSACRLAVATSFDPCLLRMLAMDVYVTKSGFVSVHSLNSIPDNKANAQLQITQRPRDVTRLASAYLDRQGSLTTGRAPASCAVCTRPAAARVGTSRPTLAAAD